VASVKMVVRNKIITILLFLSNSFIVDYWCPGDYRIVMPTFIDESGDTGQSEDSKPYFRLAAVWLPEPDRFREAIRLLKRDLGRRSNFEFKFAKTHSLPDDRRRFFQLAMDLQMRFSVCSITKRGYWRNASSKELHWATATSVSVDMGEFYKQFDTPDCQFCDPILVDQNDDRSFLKAIKMAFKAFKSRHHDSLLTEPPRFRKSHTDEALQLTDMVCGAAGANLDGDCEWWKIIESGCLGMMSLGD